MILLKSYEYFRKATILIALLKIIVTLAASYPRQSSYVFRLFSLNGHLSPARQAWA